MIRQNRDCAHFVHGRVKWSRRFELVSRPRIGFGRRISLDLINLVSEISVIIFLIIFIQDSTPNDQLLVALCCILLFMTWVLYSAHSSIAEIQAQVLDLQNRLRELDDHNQHLLVSK